MRINNAVIAMGIAALGIFFLRSRANGIPGVPNPKFRVGDHIIGSDRAPTNIVYVVTAVDQSGGTWYYTLGQWFNGQVLSPQPDYSVVTIDANYVLV